MIFKSWGTVRGGLFADPVVLPGGPVAGLAVDARLQPSGVVGVGLDIVVGVQLADVAAIAGGVEGKQRVPPGYWFGMATFGKMPDHARGGVKPFFLAHVISQRQDLEAAFFQRCQEIIDVFAAQSLDHGVRFLPLRAFLQDNTPAILENAW